MNATLHFHEWLAHHMHHSAVAEATDEKARSLRQVTWALVLGAIILTFVLVWLAYILAANGAKPGAVAFDTNSGVKIGTIADGRIVPAVTGP